MVADKREAVEAAVGRVLFNVSNFPPRVQSRLPGQDMAPLREKLVAAVLEALAVFENEPERAVEHDELVWAGIARQGRYSGIDVMRTSPIIAALSNVPPEDREDENR